MGFRTVMITADTGMELPKWFLNKWDKQFHFGVSRLDDEGKQVLNTMPIASKFERKYYASKEEDIFTDLQKALKENKEPYPEEFEIVLFHECDGITKVHIGKDFIRMYEPQQWEVVDEITHDYCYGCSTPSKKAKE